jgi:hypothetical protein
MNHNKIIYRLINEYRYYYQYRLDCLPFCTLPVHALLHVPQDIRSTGPVSGCWSWVMERFCGVLGTVAQNGRRFPNATLSNRIYHHALINYFDNQYALQIWDTFVSNRRNEHANDEAYDAGAIEGSTCRYSTSFRSRI